MDLSDRLKNLLPGQLNDIAHRKRLVRQIDEITRQSAEISFYRALALLRQHLITISTCYNTLLEDTFQQAGKPYVAIHTVAQAHQRLLRGGLENLCHRPGKETVP